MSLSLLRGRLDIGPEASLFTALRDRLLADGIVPGGGTAADFARFQDADIATSGKIIADKKITLE